MSKKTGGKSGTSTVPEPIVIVPITPAPAGIDPSLLPFPEWSDQDVNSEKWDLPKTKDPDAPTQYVDPQPVELPSSISNNLHEWKRPAQLFPDAELVMFNEVSEYPDLISGSKHLLHSDFMRSFISAINILEYLGNVQPSPMESVTATFVPNTEEDPWRPWHHIYSMTKAGKGQTHDPKVNNIGKYVVRLHWMGAWRKILVDDRLPVDATSHILLPKLEKPVIELWPFLLCKALLKVACLTWTNKEELRDFNIIYCLTGWVVHKVDTRGMDPEDVWEMCTGFADHYEWPEEGKKDNKFLKGKDSKGKDKGKNLPFFLDEEEESDVIPCHVVGTFTNMREMSEDLLPDITPCWGHNFLMAQTRDIPVNKPPPKPELEHWKKFRWLAWAIRNGLWQWDESMIPIKCVRLVSNFRKCADLVIYRPPSKESANIQKSAAIVEEVGKGKKGKDKGKTPDKKESKKDKSSKSSKDKDKGKKAKPVPLPEDPSIWVEFGQIVGFIEFLYFFMKPTQFKTYVKISDISPFVAAGKGKADKGKKSKDGKDSGQKTQTVTTSNVLLESRNEPLYLFMDTLDYKFFVINMCQVGKRDILDRIVEEKLEDSEVEEEPKEVFNLLELLKKIKSKRPEIMEVCPDRKETLTATTIEEEETATEKQPVPFSHLVLEQYNWQSNKIDDMVIFLNTYGTKGTFTNIKRGRFVARLWIKSDTPYVINILSDAPIVIGCLELILESMTQESHRTVQMCNDISGSYGQLVQKFGTPAYAEGLRNFYSSYKPEDSIKKSDLMKIHESFQKEFINLLSEYFPVGDYNKYIFAFRVLFINPSIKYKETVKNANTDGVFDDISETPLIDKMSFCSGEILILKEIERAAMTLQAFFKRIYVKKLKSLHAQTNKRYLGIFDMLKKFYSMILNVNSRLPVVANLLRRWFFYNSTMRDIRFYYTVYEDMQSTVILQHFTGTVYAPSNSWVPICRYVFHCNTPDPIKIKICLFCELSKFVVRVINNDDNNEIERFTNNVNVASYNNNANGYTVLCYGWTNSVQKISWKLTFVTLKQKKDTLLIIPEVNISKDAIVDTYKPNVYNKICRCLIKIQQDTLATFRLSVTYKNAKIHLRCTKRNGDLLGEIYGKESVILPVLLLEFVPVVNEEASLGTIISRTSSTKKRRSKSKSRSNSLTRSYSSTFLKKTQSDVASMRSSVISFRKDKRSSSARGSRDESKSSIFKDTVYIIEGFVAADTWPLTMGEWNIVEIYKEKKLLGLEYVMSLFRSASQSIRSSSERFFPRKSTESKKSGRKSGSLITLEKPYWNLCVLVNKDDQIALNQDTTREEQIKKVKISWYRRDPERYLRSQELRKQYLESHYIKPELSYNMKMSGERTSTSTSQSEFGQLSKIAQISRRLSKSLSHAEEFRKSSYLRQKSQSTVGDSKSSLKTNPSVEEIRFLKKPEPENETLPPFDLEKYQYTVIMTDDEFDDRQLKTDADELVEIEKREKAVENFQSYHEMFIEDMTKYLYDQIDRANLLDYWYQCCREKSAELIEEGFEEIDDYINKFVEEEQRKAEEAKEASKKDKKKK